MLILGQVFEPLRLKDAERNHKVENICATLTGMAAMPPMIMKPAMPVPSLLALVEQLAIRLSPQQAGEKDAVSLREFLVNGEH